MCTFDMYTYVYESIYVYLYIVDGVCTLKEGESFHVYLCMNLHIHIPNFRNKNPLSITVDVFF